MDALSKVFRLFWTTRAFVMSEEHGIFEEAIKASYCMESVAPMRLCLAICQTVAKDKHVIRKLVKQGIVYAIEDFIGRYHKVKQHASLVRKAVRMLQALWTNHPELVKPQVCISGRLVDGILSQRSGR